MYSINLFFPFVGLITLPSPTPPTKGTSVHTQSEHAGESQMKLKPKTFQTV